MNNHHRILVHVHVYYVDMWDELRSYLENLDTLGCSYDLYVTAVSEDEALITKIRHFHPDAQIRKVANRGYDVWPFISVLNEVDLSQYSYLIKLHTKRDNFTDPEPGWTIKSPYYLYGKRWRESLLSFMKKDNLEKCLQSFEEDSQLGMINCYRVIVPSFHKTETTLLKVQKGAEKLLEKVNLTLRVCRYIKGTMFIARASLFQKIKEMRLELNDFPPPDPEHSINIAHHLEVALGSIVVAQGYKVEDTFTPNVKLKAGTERCYLTIRRKTRKLFFQKKKTKSGRTIIKVCKIPVYASRKKN